MIWDYIRIHLKVQAFEIKVLRPGTMQIMSDVFTNQNGLGRVFASRGIFITYLPQLKISNQGEKAVSIPSDI